MWLPTKPDIVTSMELTHRVDLKVHAHNLLIFLKKDSPSNLNRCGLQMKSYNMELTHWH